MKQIIVHAIITSTMMLTGLTLTVGGLFLTGLMIYGMTGDEIMVSHVLYYFFGVFTACLGVTLLFFTEPTNETTDQSTNV